MAGFGRLGAQLKAVAFRSRLRDLLLLPCSVRRLFQFWRDFFSMFWTPTELDAFSDLRIWTKVSNMYPVPMLLFQPRLSIFVVACSYCNGGVARSVHYRKRSRKFFT